MRETVEIVGVNIDNVNMDEAAGMLAEYLEIDDCSMIFTPNSEILLEAVKNRELETALNSGQLVVPDGIGVVIASKFYGTPVKERVAGFDLMLRLMETAGSMGKSVYLLGGKPGIAEEAALKLTEKYDGLRIAGARDGYFGTDEEENIINDIYQKKDFNCHFTKFLRLTFWKHKQNYVKHHNYN
jgi:N-acetylglucosaminyldiphosphoundecaprenol N-acetyl-beta-D-mannosaminyltransferase